MLLAYEQIMETLAIIICTKQDKITENYLIYSMYRCFDHALEYMRSKELYIAYIQPL